MQNVNFFTFSFNFFFQHKSKIFYTYLGILKLLNFIFIWNSEFQKKKKFEGQKK